MGLAAPVSKESGLKARLEGLAGEMDFTQVTAVGYSHSQWCRRVRR